MKFAFTETRDDFGGNLTITAESPAEVQQIDKHFKIFDASQPGELMKLAEVLTAGTLTYTSEPTKRFWYEVVSALDCEFTEPYRAWLERLTGYQDSLPDMDLTPFHPLRLCYTHITDTCGLSGGHIVYKCYDQAEEWNGKDACTNAWDYVADYVGEDFGTRKHEREYIEARNGMMKRNPNYLKRHKSEPAASAGWLKAVIFDWWLANHASDEQLAIVAAVAELSEKFGHAKYGKHFSEESTLYVPDPNGTCNYDGKGYMVRVMTWKEFRELSPVPTE